MTAMTLGWRLRRIARLGPVLVIKLRLLRYLKHTGHLANVSGNHAGAIRQWTWMMRLQRRFGHGPGKVRYLRSDDWTNGIGHIAFFDFFVKRKRLGLHHSDYVMVVDPKMVANWFYLRLWRKHFSMVPYGPDDMPFYEDWPMLVELEGKYVEIHRALTRVNELWGNRPPVIEFPQVMLDYGYSKMPELRRDGWFVTFHIRHNEAPLDTVRNITDPKTYQPAIDRIRAAGGEVVLIGKMGPDFGLTGVHDLRGAPDWMDIFLISQCRFFVGSNSGPSVVAGSFGKKLLVLNYAPSGLPFPCSAITVPKRITRNGVPLAPDQPEHLRLWTVTQLADRGLELHDNTADEVLASVDRLLEMTG